MKSCLPLAFSLVIGFIPSTAPAAGSLAARVQAAQAQRREQQAAATSRTPLAPPVQHEAPLAPRTADSRAAESSRPPSGRINVADWLNGAAGEQTAAAAASPSSKELAKELAPLQPQRATSSRRSTATRPLTGQDPAPTPPDTAARSLDSFFAVPSKSTTELEPSSQDEPGTFPTTPSTLLELHGADNAPADSAPADSAPADSAPADSAPADSAPADNAPADQDAGREAELAVEAVEPVEQEAMESEEPDAKAVELDEEADEYGSQEQATPEEAEPVDITPVVPEKQFSAQMLRLRDRNRSCLMYYYQRPENVAERSPWGVMHALISFGVDTEVQVGRQRANAIGWLCYNRPCRGMKLLQLDGEYPVPRNGPGYQGHEGQLLSMLALSRVKPTYPMRVDGKDLTVQDLIDYEQVTCRPKTELTFKLVSLAHYLPSDATWTSKWGETWSIPRLIQEELAQPINGACCGGTHRLIGYSMAVKVRQKRGEPLDGQWLRAQKYVDSYHKYVIKLQNRDGSFSTSWLKKRDESGDLDRRIQTTGHILEWLVFSLPQDELTDPRIVRAVSFLSSSLLKYRQKEWEIGPRGHALRALALYNERVFGDKPGERRALLARRPQK